MAQLILEHGEPPGLRVPLDRPRIRIGRAPEMDVVLNAHFISRFHAEVFLQDECYWITVGANRHPLRINGHVINGPVLLSDRDQIAIVDHILRFETEGSLPPNQTTIDPRWLTSTVLDLAAMIADEPSLERLPLLSDALMDAGCDCESILNHLRTDHADSRQCWVVELLLGRIPGMTAANWATCQSPIVMLEFVRRQPSQRKWRLFALACCRTECAAWFEGLSSWDRIAADALKVFERFVDGRATAEELNAASETAWRIARNSDPDSPSEDIDVTIWREHCRRRVAQTIDLGSLPQAGMVDSIVSHIGTSLHLNFTGDLPPIIRDIFGNPFRNLAVDSNWLTPGVLQIAQSMDAQARFHRMHDLADALVDAGCDNEDILNHCRTNQPHVRGCWVLDLLLSKE